ncbi:MAG: hypothetical protein PVI03_07465 [Candidatus Thorarchaeota archaeon]|jgi:hypothetical protein
MSEDITLRYPAVATADDVDKLIGGAIDAAKTMKRKVQYAAVGIMIMAAWEGRDEETGTEFAELAIEKANYLVEQVGAGVKGEGLVKFFVYRCGFKINEAAKKDGFYDVANPEWIANNLEAAKATQWWDYAPATPFKGFEFEKELSKLLERADNMAKAAETDPEKAKLISIDRDMLEVMHSLMAGKPVQHEHALQLVTRLVPQSTAPVDAVETAEAA